ncbi:MAG: hypothetical protein E7434_07955 [Ruminococcaceae bacterium]|nr:hypothetical protein [Oscillospiraceae bacterium]
MELNENKVTVCDIQFRNGSKIYFFDPQNLNVKTGDDVIIDTSRGPEFGRCVAGNHEVAQKDTVAPLRPVIRIATEQDRKIDAENRNKEKNAHAVCLEKIEALGLEMQLVSTEYAFDGSKILFFFTADGRVDFRELVKNLAYVLRTRIELRQIGVRDKAKLVGGLGICGRPFCCREFLEDFQPVSIKMAKTQNLSLNPTKISGTCGRLMCCLNYEQEAYEDLHRTSPKAESFVDTPDGRGTVTEVNLLRQSVKVRLENQPDTIVCHKNCDICVLRNGKAKKNDEPIPDDLAPISGGKQKKEKEKPMFSTYLEPVVMRNAKESEAAPTDAAEATEESRKRRNRRNNKGNKKLEKPEKTEKVEKTTPTVEQKKSKLTEQKKPVAKPEAPAEPAGEEKPAKKKNNYRRYHKRHHKNNGPKSEG